MLNKNIKISLANVNDRIFSSLIDLAIILATAVALFFACFYGIFRPTTNYEKNETYINETLRENNLDLGYVETYVEYESVCKKFYFETYSNEIVNNFYERTGSSLSINHIYNFEILGLPLHPDLDNYDTSDYFSFKTEGTKILVDEIADTKKSGGPNFDRNIKMIFKNGYESLFNYLNVFDENYKNAKWENVNIKSYARLLASLVSVLIFALVIPISNKKKSSIGEMIMKISSVNYGDGFYARWWKILLRPFILFSIPILGVYFGSTYAIIILTVGPLFINFLTLILAKDNLDITQKILRLDLAYNEESLLFHNEKEEEEYIESEEFKHLDDKEYLEKLEKLSKIDLSESRSDNITKNKDNNDRK